MVAAGSAAVTLTGCATSSDPRLSPAPASPQTAAWTTAAAAELTLAGAYIAAASVVPAWARWCQSAATLHGAHAVVLRQPDPFGGYSGGKTPAPTPATPPTDKAAALAAVTQAASAVTQAASAGLTAGGTAAESLLWASLMATVAVDTAWCSAPDSARQPFASGVVLPRPMAALSPADAASTALSLLNRLIAVLTTALGQVPAADPLHAAMADRLAQTGPLRDSLQHIIQTPSPAALTYDLPAHLGSPDVARRYWGQTEDSLGQAYTRLAAALASDSATPAANDALSAATQAGDQLARASSLDRVITWWPGWQ